MAADPFQTYSVIAQIAAAFAGFGSLASGLGQRRGGDDSRMDAYRLEHMLEASLSATFLGLLPAALGGLLSDEWLALRICAGIAMAAILVYAPLAVVRARTIRHVAGFSRRATVINSLCIWGSFVLFGLCVAAHSGPRAADLFLLGLMGLLGSTMMLFSRVIVSMLRPLHQTSDPE